MLLRRELCFDWGRRLFLVWLFGLGDGLEAGREVIDECIIDILFLSQLDQVQQLLLAWSLHHYLPLPALSPLEKGELF